MIRLLNRLQVFVRSISKGEQARRSQDRPGPAQIPVRMDYVRDTFEAIRAALGDEYTMGDLLLLLQKVYRKKDLLIERVPMPADQEGSVAPSSILILFGLRRILMRHKSIWFSSMKSVIFS